MLDNPPARRVVGIGGQLASGKDSLADHLAERLNGLPAARPLGGPWRRTAFAAGLKRIFCDTFGVDLAFIEKWKRESLPPPGFSKTVRQILIDIGDGFRTFKADVWIERALHGADNVIVSDARYENEMMAIKARGGFTVLLYRPDHENDNPNASEQQLMPYVRRFLAAGVRGPTGDPLVDYFFVNDGDLDALRHQADTRLVPALLTHAGGR